MLRLCCRGFGTGVSLRKVRCEERMLPPNNWMQLTRSARCKGGYAPPSQLNRVFGGHDCAWEREGAKSLHGTTGR